MKRKITLNSVYFWIKARKKKNGNPKTKILIEKYPIHSSKIDEFSMQKKMYMNKMRRSFEINVFHFLTQKQNYEFRLLETFSTSVDQSRIRAERKQEYKIHFMIPFRIKNTYKFIFSFSSIHQGS